VPDLHNETVEIAERIHAHLSSLLPTAKITSVDSAPALSPLLLLETEHNVAAFALPNGNWRADFETQYSGFKNLCDRHEREWEQLDANFVFCLPHPDENFDAFCSQVETDVYFCRKFVIPLNGNLELAFARLPFLPLDPLEGGLRPDSAQSLLHRHGVSSVLARYLALPGKSSPDKIINDCLANQFGEPVVSTALPRIRAVAAEPSKEPIRIQQIEIENFRAYRKPQVFDIASDVTVLYGPNGFGKTSFFDAIDFAVTGSIGRLNALTDGQFRKAAPYFDSDPTKSIVTLTAANSSKTLRIQRSVGSPNYATLNGEREDRKSILAALTGAGSPSTERIDHLVELFRATHQFNQEVQELTREFQKDCRLKSGIVSRMLAFEDYNNAVSKASQVHGNLLHRIAGLDSIIAEAEASIAASQEEVGRLSQPIQVDGSVSTVQGAIVSLRERLAAARIDANEDPVDAAVVRGWRAAVAVRHAKHASTVQRLTELSTVLATLPESRQLLETRSQALPGKEKEHSAAETRHAEAELASQRAEQSLAETIEKVKQFTAHRQVLEWIRSTKPRYTEALTEERKLAAELDVISVQLREQRTHEEKLAVDLHAAEVELTQHASGTTSLQQQLTFLTSLLESHPHYVEQGQRLKALESAKQTFDQELGNLQPALRQLTQEQNDLSAEEKRIDAQIKRAAAQQSELKRLLSDLAGHIHSGVCPVCAANYGAKEILLERIQAHANAEVASETQQQLQRIREKLAATKQGLADLAAKKLSTEQKATAVQAEKNQIESNLAAFRNTISGSGLAPDSPAGVFTEEVRRRITAVSSDISKHDALAIEKQRLLGVLRASLDAIRQSSRQKQFEREEKAKTLTSIRAELGRMRADPRLGQASLDIDDAQLTEAERLAAENLARTTEAMKSAEQLAAQRKAEMNNARQAVIALRPEVQNLRSQIAAGKKWMAEFEAKLAAQNLPLTLTPDDLAELLSKESRHEAEFALLGDTVANLELVLDAATTAAALTRINENIHSAEKRKADAVRDRGQLVPWADYFNELRSLLSAQQNTAIANFTREYGPRASVIQRRLRSVYGFDDITLSPDGSDIVVRATRRGEPLRPIDYFSQSQQQSLLLSIFLTACSSQTWSNFSPVLLDDPVTHFDDLNTYALLDLLVGLLDAGSGPRQFILATCDDRLFQLARQKFRHLGSRAAFYAFLSSGEDGPQIESLPTS
jgi:exonuclease SbcC